MENGAADVSGHGQQKWNTDTLTRAFVERHGAFCAALPISNTQKIYYLALAALLVFLLFYRWDVFMVVITVSLMFCYAVAVFLKVASAILSFGKHAEIRIGESEKNAISDADLPIYTILIPLYHESAVAEKILKRLARIDYPQNKLDVKLLLETDDTETAAALDRSGIPAWCEKIVIPDGLPRTKPRACNYGLAAARGEFCVIYDAEDAPEADQLKKAVAAFRRDVSGKLLCVQAKLNYYNPYQNLLTRFFTVEYSTNFDLQLPGLQRFRLPLPLGGTSNHFRTRELQEVGGWDPFNVTEDCDLGIRIYECGYRTAVLESTTWEEANSRLGNWIRQRSRWVKGFFQTHLVHYRNPFRTMSRLGFRGFFGCYASVGGSVLMMLANLVFWPVILLYAFLLLHAMAAGESPLAMIVGPQRGGMLYQGVELCRGVWLKAWPLVYTGELENPLLSRLSQILFVGGVFLFSMNLVLVLIHVAACCKRKFYRLIPAALLMPFYWVLISIGAWKGVIQFLYKPFYWEKTRHGLDAVPGEEEQSAS